MIDYLGSGIEKIPRIESHHLSRISQVLAEIWNVDLKEEERIYFEQNLKKILSLTKLSIKHLTLAFVYANKLKPYYKLKNSAKVLATLSILKSSKDHLEYGIWVGCLMISSKYLDDITFKNKSWGILSGLPTKELNSIEAELLKSLNFCLFTSTEELSKWEAIFMKMLCEPPPEQVCVPYLHENITFRSLPDRSPNSRPLSSLGKEMVSLLEI